MGDGVFVRGHKYLTTISHPLFHFITCYSWAHEYWFSLATYGSILKNNDPEYCATIWKNVKKLLSLNITDLIRDGGGTFQ